MWVVSFRTKKKTCTILWSVWVALGFQGKEDQINTVYNKQIYFSLKNSGAGFFLWILWNIWEHHAYRAPFDYFWKFKKTVKENSKLTTILAKIFGKVKHSKIGQDFENVISNFACFLTVIVKV